MSAPRPLDADALYMRCDVEQLSFETTSDLDELHAGLGQQRATEAIRFGIGMPDHGYGLYALGEPGAGRRSLVEHFMRERAADQDTPPDWVYVNNFTENHKPVAIRLPAGRGAELRADMRQLMEDLQAALPAAFESEDYRARRKELEQKLQEEQESRLEELDEKARERGVMLIRTRRGMAFAPMKDDGEVMPAEEFNELPEEQRKKTRDVISELEQELEKVFHQLPRWQREARRKIRDLDREVTRSAVDNLIDDVESSWRDHDEVLAWMEAVKEDVVDNAGDFLPQDDSGGGMAALFGGAQAEAEDKLKRFRVNVLVDNTHTEGAPVVFENHPSYHNLFGRIEHMSRMGNLTTDFTLIKPGALHRANGGYLVLEARKLLTQPFAYEALKRMLFAGQLRIESLGQEFSLISTVSLEPEAIPMDVKVALVGSRLLYYLLSQYDEEFGRLFKVAADFEDDMPRSDENLSDYARMIATLARSHDLRPLDRDATARVIEQGAREAEDAERLSVHVEGIGDLLREADFWARERGADVVSRADVRKAVEARRYRAGRVPERIRDTIRRGILLIDTEDRRAGQVNGLTVSRTGQSSFGFATRITARVRLGHGEVKDIQREVKMAGPIFSKAVMTLTGYLGAHYAPDFPLMLGASLVFEQTYGGVEGDSATVAELLALLSALADVPLAQSLAVTGSANQYGEVQAVGGVNDKIEGFFDICAERGLDGSHGVLIPAANVKHLMLREDVVDAVEHGRFSVYPVRRVDEALACMTGEDAGEPDDRGRFAEGTVNHRVQKRLLEMAEQAKKWGRGAKSDDGDDA